MMEYSWEEFQSSESFGLIYKDAPSRKIDKKDPSQQFHSHPHMASTTICLNFYLPLSVSPCQTSPLTFFAYFQLSTGNSPLRDPTGSSKLRAQNETHHLLSQPASPSFYLLRASFMGEWPMLRRALHLV